MTKDTRREKLTPEERAAEDRENAEWIASAINGLLIRDVQ